MRILWFNLSTDLDDPILGFTTSWINAVAVHVEHINVITMRMGRLDVAKNVSVYSVGKEMGFSEIHRAVRFYRRLADILRNNEITGCFSHMIPIFSIMAAPILKMKGIPLITWYAHRQITPTVKWAHRLSDKIVASAESSYPYKHDKLAVLGQGIDTDVFRPKDDLPHDSGPLILFVGRISPIKNIETLISAVDRVVKAGRNVQCSIIGSAAEKDKPYETQLKERVRELGLEKTIEFEGPVLYQSLPSWYRKSFLHVNCSPADHSLDKTVLEAMACGIPSISSTEGFRPVMGQWAGDLIFNHAHPKDLAAKITNILNQEPSRRLAMGSDLRRTVIERHSLINLSESLNKLFLRVPH